jgi:FkbH-like protein
MKLLEALNAVEEMRQRKGDALSCYLATGFSPLHLKTFLQAELFKVFPDREVGISEGLFGDLCGNLDRFEKSESEFGMIFVEWSDLDPRLGIRCTARWDGAELSDILSTARVRARQLQQQIEDHSQLRVVAISLPTLPLPPFSFTPSRQASSYEMDLREIVQSLASAISRCSLVRVLNPQYIDLESPLEARFDIESELLTGFPYRLPHASSLSLCVARLLRPQTPKRALITDLDETLWKGILGEDGIDGISWDLEHRSQMHAFYQRFLGSLASEGVLIGAASKNEISLVKEALRREDLALSSSVIFPIEAHWNPKSQSVARILDTWNINADSVVFVDDSPLELAEVEAGHPGITCLQFPTNSRDIQNLIFQLRDLFGKSAIHHEDAIRSESIRRTRAGEWPFDRASTADFLEQTKAEVTFEFNGTLLDSRALELVNKTNQFNLNGRRHTESSWMKLVTESSGFLMVASYRDKFGPLGRIAVIAGKAEEKRLRIHTWVMSCRAFSRRIEYKCLAELIARFEPEEITFEYEVTGRNAPLRDFLGEVLETSPSPNCAAARDVLDRRLANFVKLPETANG